MNDNFYKNSTVEVLLSTMHQKNLNFLSKINIQTDAIVVNQTDKQDYLESTYNGNHIVFISSSDRGLSKSRNLALDNAKADICLICDDDLEYVDGYKKAVINAFAEVEDADIIIFDSLMTHRDGSISTKGFKKVKKIHKYKTYSSVLIAFRREVVVNKNIRFNTDFGTGSGKYGMCEDAIFLRDCYKKGLKAYCFPFILHKCVYGESTWFKGYNEKYFYDTGAFLAQSYGRFKHFVKWYYPIRMMKLSELSMSSIIREINSGMRGYKKGMGYNEYYEKKQ